MIMVTTASNLTPLVGCLNSLDRTSTGLIKIDMYTSMHGLINMVLQIVCFCPQEILPTSTVIGVGKNKQMKYNLYEIIQPLKEMFPNVTQ